MTAKRASKNPKHPSRNLSKISRQYEDKSKNSLNKSFNLLSPETSNLKAGILPESWFKTLFKSCLCAQSLVQSVLEDLPLQYIQSIHFRPKKVMKLQCLGISSLNLFKANLS